MLTVGSLFSGVGGLDLGLERAGMRVVWQAEIDNYASRVLAKHWPDVRNHGDVTAVDWSAVERPDVLAGGFMCTDVSNAGEGGGLDETTRSGITWREFLRCIGNLQPSYILAENVPALLAGDGGRWFATVLGGLASLGYDAEWDCIPASALGAYHRRDRIWIVAYPASIGREESGILGQVPLHSLARGEWQTTDAIDAIRRGAVPALCRGAHGLPRRMDRLRGLGNAVVPAVAELIGGWIVEHARRTWSESEDADPAGLEGRQEGTGASLAYGTASRAEVAA